MRLGAAVSLQVRQRRGFSMLGTTITITASGFSRAPNVLASPIVHNGPPVGPFGASCENHALGSNGAARYRADQTARYA